jgi:hypothetical protein
VPRRLTPGRLAVVALGLGLAAASAAAAPAPAGPAVTAANQALVIVETGSERFETYVSFTAESISGLEALELAGMDPVARTFGANGYAVCALCGRGCPADGSCLTCDAPNYWAYWRDAAGGGDGFVYSGSGAGSARVGNGDVEGWRWGTGSAPAWEPFSPPPPPPPSTTTTAAPTTTSTAAPPPSSAPATTAPPRTTTTAAAGGAPSTSTSTSTSTSGSGTGGSTTSATAAGSSSSSSSVLAGAGSSTTAAGAGGGRYESTSDGSGPAVAPSVDGSEVAAVDAPTVDGGGSAGSALRSLLLFAAVLGVIGAAIVRVRLTRRAAAGR